MLGQHFSVPAATVAASVTTLLLVATFATLLLSVLCAFTGTQVPEIIRSL